MKKLNYILLAIISVSLFNVQPLFAADSFIRSIKAKGKVGVNLTYNGVDSDQVAADSIWSGAMGGFFMAFVGASNPVGLGFVIATAFGVKSADNNRKVKTMSVSLPMEIGVHNFAEGKAHVLLRGAQKKKCKPFATKLIAIADSTGAYTIYANEDELANGEAAGQMFVYEDSIYVDFISSLHFRTEGKKSYSCQWEISQDTDVSFTY